MITTIVYTILRLTYSIIKVDLCCLLDIGNYADRVNSADLKLKLNLER